MKRFLLFLLLYVFAYFLFFFVIFLIYSPCASGQNEPRVKFIKTLNINEFKAELYVIVHDDLYLDLDDSYLSFIDNNPMSIDCGEYRILHFKEDGIKLYSVFTIENSAPPKFVRLQLVFRDKFSNKLITKSDEYKLILENNFWILPKKGPRNIFYVYFNDTHQRDILLLDLLSNKIMYFKNITSGGEVDVGDMPQGIYFFRIENFSTKKIFLK